MTPRYRDLVQKIMETGSSRYLALTPKDNPSDMFHHDRLKHTVDSSLVLYAWFYRLRTLNEPAPMLMVQPGVELICLLNYDIVDLTEVHHKAILLTINLPWLWTSNSCPLEEFLFWSTMYFAHARDLCCSNCSHMWHCLVIFAEACDLFSWFASCIWYCP